MFKFLYERQVRRMRIKLNRRVRGRIVEITRLIESGKPDDAKVALGDWYRELLIIAE